LIAFWAVFHISDLYFFKLPFLKITIWARWNASHSCKAIYCDAIHVGFLMWVQVSPEKVSIWRFMVDKHHQHKGIGRKALVEALNTIKQTRCLKEIEICYNPKNPVAKDFY